MRLALTSKLDILQEGMGEGNLRELRFLSPKPLFLLYIHCCRQLSLSQYYINTSGTLFLFKSIKAGELIHLRPPSHMLIGPILSSVESLSHIDRHFPSEFFHVYIQNPLRNFSFLSLHPCNEAWVIP